MEIYKKETQPDLQEENIEIENGEWCYEKKNGRWGLVLLPELGNFDTTRYEEKERRSANFLEMFRETGEEWNLDEDIENRNEGFLRDHPRYRELFIKWAMRYIKKKGFDRGKFSGQIDEFEGNLLGHDGNYTDTWLVNAVENGRELVDEYVEMELRISEGFVDITNDYELREELGIEPEHEGWWAQNDI